MKTREYSFSIEGGFDIDTKLKPEISQVMDNIIAFHSPRKRISLIMALEVEDNEGNVKIVTKESEMAKLGFAGLDYRHLHFYKGGV